MRRVAVLSMLVLGVFGSVAERGLAVDARTAWQYEAKNGVRTIVSASHGRWIEYSAIGQTDVFVETERTEKYVQLRRAKDDRAKAVLYRLFAEFGQLRRPEVGEFRQFAKARWLDSEAYDLTSVDKLGADDHRIRLVYFVPKDRKVIPKYAERIAVVMSYVAEFFQRDLREKGFQTDGLPLELRDGKPVVHLVRAEQDARFYNRGPNYDKDEQNKRIIDEIERTVCDIHRHLVVVFTESYDPGPAEKFWPGHMAIAGAYPPDGGIGIVSAWVLKDEVCALTVPAQAKLFFDQTPVRGRSAIGHNGPNSPRFELVEDGFGAVLHEVAHALGCPHDARDNNFDFMGQGFRNLRFAVRPGPGQPRVGFSAENARILRASRFLAQDADFLDYVRPEVQIELNHTGSAIGVTVHASDDQGLRSVIVLFDNGKDESIVAGRELSGKESRVELSLPNELLKLPAPKIRAFVNDVGGNQTRVGLGAQTDNAAKTSGKP